MLKLSVAIFILISTSIIASPPNSSPYSVTTRQNYSTANNAPNSNNANMIILPSNRFEKTLIYSKQQIAAEKKLRIKKSQNNR
ncbi:MAG: hypothetical protein ACJA0H_001171 [Francisellaceae bacterium]|jgi:hypothetical protein